MIHQETMESNTSSFKVSNPVATTAVFIWIGFVCAISFMEAWLKFRAPGVTLPLGLGIGCLIFDALNKVEWTLAAIVAISMVYKNMLKWRSVAFYLPVIILLHQTMYLLPALKIRAGQYINDIQVEPSTIHIQYVVLEIIKIGSLVYFGISQFKKTKPC